MTQELSIWLLVPWSQLWLISIIISYEKREGRGKTGKILEIMSSSCKNLGQRKKKDKTAIM